MSTGDLAPSYLEAAMERHMFPETFHRSLINRTGNVGDWIVQDKSNNYIYATSTDHSQEDPTLKFIQGEPRGNLTLEPNIEIDYLPPNTLGTSGIRYHITDDGNTGSVLTYSYENSRACATVRIKSAGNIDTFKKITKAVGDFYDTERGVNDNAEFSTSIGFGGLLLARFFGEDYENKLKNLKIDDEAISSIRHAVQNQYNEIILDRNTYEFFDSGSSAIVNQPKKPIGLIHISGLTAKIAASFNSMANIVELVENLISGEDIELHQGLNVLYRIAKEHGFSNVIIPPYDGIMSLKLDSRFFIDSIDLIVNASPRWVSREHGEPSTFEIALEDYFEEGEKKGIFISFLNNGTPLHEKHKRDDDGTFNSLFDANISTKGKGHGNGLYYWSNTVKAMGGEARIESPPPDNFVSKGYTTRVVSFFPSPSVDGTSQLTELRNEPIKEP